MMASNSAAPTIDVVRPLRLWLRLDSASCAGTGLLTAAGSPLLAPLLGYPAGFLVPLGCFLVALAVVFALLASGRGLTAGAAKGVIGINVAWVVASVALVISGAFGPTMIGVGFVVVQAVAVAGIAFGQSMTLRTAAPALTS